MNLTKMRHQATRGAGEALIINGLSYGRTSGDVLRDYTRPLEAEVARRMASVAPAIEQTLRVALEHAMFPQRWITADLDGVTWEETSPGVITNATPVTVETRSGFPGGPDRQMWNFHG